MVKTRSPLASTSARGALAGTLAFRQHRRGTTILRSPKPHDPRTPAQLGHRALMRGLQTYWKAYTQAYRDAWKPTPESSNHDAYLAYLKYNLTNFPNNLAINVQNSKIPTPLSWTTASKSLTPKVHSIRILHDKTGLPPLGGYLLYRREGGIPDTTINELVLVTWKATAIEFDYTDVVPTLNTYGYALVWYNNFTQKSNTVTFDPVAPLDE